jgi:hypothetical protein
MTAAIGVKRSRYDRRTARYSHLDKSSLADAMALLDWDATPPPMQPTKKQQ